MTTSKTFVIVGASLTGAKAAETLRTEGFDGRLVLIGAGQLTRYLAEMARMLDYHVVVIDPRDEYAAGWDLAAVATWSSPAATRKKQTV